MIIKIKKIYCVVILSVYGAALMADVGQKAVTPTFVARSQGRDKVRQDIGLGWRIIERPDLQEKRAPIVIKEEPVKGFFQRIFSSAQPDQESVVINKQSHHEWYGFFTVMPAYMQSFNDHAVGDCLFGSDICNDVIKVQGSAVEDRNARAWLADYLYLSPDFDGNFSVKPAVKNFLVDLDVYIGLDHLLTGGFYLRAYAPLVWTQWRMNFCEPKLKTAAVSGYSEGYFTPDALPASSLNQSITAYMNGKSPTVEDFTMYGLEFAKISNCHDTKVTVADVRMELGWNYVKNEYQHFTLNMQAAIPTGNMRKATFAFEPVVGNGNHGELGGGFNTHYTFWHDAFKESYALIYFDLNITHMFGAYEQRTFDLSDSPNSRYMLAQRIEGPVFDGLQAAPDSGVITMMGTPPIAQFKNVYCPVANITTAQVKVSNAIQVDFVAYLNFTRKNWSVDVGYNLWVRSCDKIANDRKCSSPLSVFNEDNENVWALKGDAHMFGYATAAAGGLVLDQAVLLSATESIATIHSGTNSLIPEANALERNLGVDSAEFAYAGGTAQRLNYARGLANIDDNQIKTSLSPEFINFANINFQPTQGLSNKFFVNVDYISSRNGVIKPYVGLGMFVEVGNNKTKIITPQTAESSFIDVCDDTCITCSLSQWGAWVKAGFIFG
jgi:hypothetical protein